MRAHEIEFCITELSRFCDVRTLKTTEPKTREIVYVLRGYTSDIQAAIQLILLVKSTMDASFASFMATYAGSAHGKTLRTSFMKEFGVRMNARLRAIKIERTSTSNSTSLVVVKGEEVNKALHQKYPDIRQRTITTTVRSKDGLEAGQAAANNVILSRNGSHITETRKIA